MSETPTKARHLHFVKSKQKRLARGLLGRDDDDEDSEDTESEDEGSSTTRKTLTSTAPQQNTATLASTTTSTSASVTLSTPSATATVLSMTSITTSIAPPSTSLGGPSSLITSMSATTSKTAGPPPTESPTSLAVVTGAAAEITSSKSASSTIAAVVIPILAFVFIAGFALWFIRRRRTDTRDNDNTNPSPPARRLYRESRIWGGTTTVGTLTEVNFPVSQIPASMRPGGRDYYKNNLPRPETSGSHLSDELRLGPPQRTTTSNPFPSKANIDMNNAASRASIPNRERLTMESSPPLKSHSHAEMRVSVATTVPHFRNVTSWARDQRSRTARKLEGIPAGPYYKV